MKEMKNWHLGCFIACAFAFGWTVATVGGYQREHAIHVAGDAPVLEPSANGGTQWRFPSGGPQITMPWVDVPVVGDNLMIGHDAGRYLTSGSFNTCIGEGSCKNLRRGSHNTVIGKGADVDADDCLGATAIGDGVIVHCEQHVPPDTASMPIVGFQAFEVPIDTPTSSFCARDRSRALAEHIQWCGPMLGARAP